MVENEAPLGQEPIESWDAIAQWWRSDVEGDLVYDKVLFPLYRSLTDDLSGTILDLGCGDGQAMPMTGPGTVGADESIDLLAHARANGPVVRVRAPDLRAFSDVAFDAVVSIYLVDLVEEVDRLFAEVARIIRSGGVFVVVLNHPIYTAPGAAPISDNDGEVLWRWGQYHEVGHTVEPAGDAAVRFYHRPLGTLLGAAADAGLQLMRFEERGLGTEVVEAMPGYFGQEDIPRLLGVRWKKP